MPEIEQTRKKLAEFTKLERGWHFGEGGPISTEEIGRAANFLNTAEELGVEKANAFPLVSGEIELTFYRGNRTIAFVLESHGKFSITVEDECEIISDVYGQPYSVAEEILKGISQDMPTTSDLSTSNSGIQTIKNSEIPSSRAHQQNTIPAKEYLPSPQDVLWKADELFQSTPNTFTVQIPAYR